MAGDKPFDATHARLARAKREGDVPRSQDLTGLVSLGCAALALFGSLGVASAAARHAIAAAARSGGPASGPYLPLAGCVLGVIAAALAGAVAATYAQTQTMTFAFPALKFEKLSPIAGLKRMLSRDGALAAVKALCVASGVSALLVPVVRDAFDAGTAGFATPAALAALVVDACRGVLVGALAVGLLFAAGDVLLERTKWKRRLRMDFDEIKRDHKATEGDPLVRGRRRRTHHALVRGSIGRLKEAAFLVTNPTHIALAFEYRPPEVAVPRVLVRATGAGAQAVKRRARELHLPVVEDVPLARSLFAGTEVGDYIPPAAYAAMAAVVAALLRDDAIVA